MEITHKLPPSLETKKRKIFPSLYISNPIDIPANSSEIILSSLKNLDLNKLVKKDLKQKITNNETNDFHFYDIPMFLPKEEVAKIKKPNQNYKSIHNNIDLLQLKNFTSKIFVKPSYNDLEKKARISLKRSGSQLMLNEMYSS